MNWKMLFFIIGKVMWIGAFLMLLPLAVTLIYKEENIKSFLIPITGLIILGFILGIKKPAAHQIYAKEGFIIVAVSWILLSVFGSVPFMLSVEGMHFVDALFETVSGLTTTGASIFTNVEVLPHGLLFWRSFTHWVGGMGVLVFVLAILPQSDSHAVHLMRAEVPGPQKGKLVSKVRFTVQILYGMYIALTILEILFLLAGGMPVFDSVVNSFATAGTGGFSIQNASIAHYNSTYVDIVISTFMIIFGINFNLFYLVIAGNLMSALKSEELRWYLSIIAVSVLLVSINTFTYFKSVGDTLRHTFFQVASIITTTGFATTDFNLWPSFSKVILIILMFIGACAGSTGGGLKISRVIILFKSSVAEIRRMASPHSIHTVRFEKHPMDTSIVRGANIYFTLLILCTAVSFLLLSLDDLSLVTAFTAVAACINNIGPGLEVVGPMGNYSSLAVLSKAVLIFDMLAGRLELFPILMVFSPGAWLRR